MPFFHFRFVELPTLQYTQFVAVVGAFALAWRRRREAPEAAMVLKYYGTWFVVLPFYKTDTHYFMPMLVALPAVFALGTDAATRLNARAGIVATAAIAGLFAWSAPSVHGVLRTVYGSEEFHSVSDELAVIERLDGLGVGEDEFYGRTWWVDRGENMRLGYLYHLFSDQVGIEADLSVGHGRCIRIDRPDAPVSAHVMNSSEAGRWRIDVIEGSSCESNLEPFGKPIWYLDLNRLEIVKRQAGPEAAD
jgi:hypothetical protein